MIKAEKELIKNKKTVAVYPLFGGYGIEIKDIRFDVNDYVQYVLPDGSVHEAIIKYNEAGESYFRFGNNRIMINECMRVGGI